MRRAPQGRLQESCQADSRACSDSRQPWYPGAMATRLEEKWGIGTRSSWWQQVKDAGLDLLVLLTLPMLAVIYTVVEARVAEEVEE